MIKRCATCGSLFHTNRPRQEFCSRKCFKISYIKRQKENKPPVFICPKCKNTITLDFNPLKDKRTWEEFVCPNCGYKKSIEELIN